MRVDPSVTAIIPCFGAGSLVLRAINSLLAQSMPPREVIVIDDASTDDGTQCALEAAARMPTVRVLMQETNQGVAVARNRGLEEAAGDFVVFLDADDLFTSSSVAAFVQALSIAPECDFAYPAVRCFGNRDDFFAPPPFNAYVLHHVNIVPIASMVTRRAVDTGVRFDATIDVGHEDWDYWLRLSAEGLIGRACPDATLLYRRMGLTRVDLGNQLDGGFDRVLRDLRPDLFNGARLAALKAAWAPALTVVSDDPESTQQLLAFQTCRDAEVIPFEGLRAARGRLVMIAPTRGAEPLADTRACERAISALLENPARPFISVDVLESRVRPGAGHALRAADVVSGAVRPTDISAITIQRNQLDGVDGSKPDAARAMLVDRITAAALNASHDVLWTSTIAERASRLDTPSRPLDHPPAGAETPSSAWLRAVVDDLAPAVPWRLASDGHGLFRDSGPSTLKDLYWGRQSAEGATLYDDVEEQPPGVTRETTTVTVFASDVAGARALMRVVDHRSGRRGVAVDPLPTGVTAERVLGFVAVAPETGFTPVHDAEFGNEARQLLGWGPSTQQHPDMRDVLERPLLGARRVWRARDPADDHRLYGLSPLALERQGAEVEGPVFTVLTEDDGTRPCVPVRMVLSDDQRVVGLTCSGRMPRSYRLGPVLGFLLRAPASGLRVTAIWSRSGKCEVAAGIGSPKSPRRRGRLEVLGVTPG